MLSFTQFGDVKATGTLEWGMALDMGTRLQINWSPEQFAFNMQEAPQGLGKGA